MVSRSPLPNPEPAQRGRRPLHLVQQLGVSEDAALAALVEVDEGRVPAAPACDVVVEGVVGEVGLGADEPAERREGPLEDAIPCLNHGSSPRGARPERLRIAKAVFNPSADDRIHGAHGGNHTVGPVLSASVAPITRDVPARRRPETTGAVAIRDFKTHNPNLSDADRSALVEQLRGADRRLARRPSRRPRAPSGRPADPRHNRSADPSCAAGVRAGPSNQPGSGCRICF